MRVAVLADVHGNLPALEAVLVEVEVAAVDRLAASFGCTATVSVRSLLPTTARPWQV